MWCRGFINILVISCCYFAKSFITIFIKFHIIVATIFIEVSLKGFYLSVGVVVGRILYLISHIAAAITNRKSLLMIFPFITHVDSAYSTFMITFNRHVSHKCGNHVALCIVFRPITYGVHCLFFIIIGMVVVSSTIQFVSCFNDLCFWILLRYFNPIGAHESGLLGDDPNGIPNNLMPYIGRVAAGQLEKLTIFGGDYDTPDGTCQRDYLHVVDLAIGHLKALEYAENHNGVEAINLGTGNGISVLELVNAFDKANNMKLPYVIGPRRDGDLPAFWADATKAKELLGWEATHTVEDMCRSSWEFARKSAE